MRVLKNDSQIICNEYAVANLKIANSAKSETAEKCAAFQFFKHLFLSCHF